MKKFAKVALITVGIIVAIPVLTLATTATVNAVATSNEAGRLVDYGQKVDVDGKKMNVLLRGDGEQTIVLLPGLGTAAPGLDFEPLIEQLEGNFRVAAVEPFGTGLSDQTDVPRTNENIVREVHEALTALNIDRFILMGHSIAGIYSLEYISQFPDQVTAFVGIDSSVPNQPMDPAADMSSLAGLKGLGLLRVLNSVGPDAFEGQPFSEEVKDQMRILTTRNNFAPAQLSELSNTNANFEAARALSFPPHLPVLLFVLEEDADVEGWVELHAEQLTQTDRGEMVLMQGDHYLHHSNSPQIAADLKRFLAEQK